MCRIDAVVSQADISELMEDFGKEEQIRVRIELQIEMQRSFEWGPHIVCSTRVRLPARLFVEG